MDMTAVLKMHASSSGTDNHAPTGHQQTDLGLIPSDWKIIRVDDVCRLINGRGFKPHEWRTRGLPIIRIQNLNGSTEFNHFEGLYDRKIEVGSGQLLFAWSGSRGTSFGPHTWNGPLGLLNYHTWKVVVDPSAVSPDFFFHALKGLTEFIEGQAHGASALVHVQKWQMEAFRLAIPETVGEQNAIAEALSDVDALIETLEALIAKKRAIEQCAMQCLLTPKRGWIECRLGNVAQLKARIGWQGLTTAEYLDDGEFKLVTGTDFEGGFIDWNNCHYVEQSRYEQDKNIQLRENDVLVTKDGTIGKVAFIDHLPKPATLNSGVFVIRPKENSFQPKFLYYLLRSHIFDSFLAKLSAGSTISHLYQKDFVGFSFFIPPTEGEQDDISATLMDMDHEIHILDMKLAKARHIKQGMMQDLLTGRIRLV